MALVDANNLIMGRQTSNFAVMGKGSVTMGNLFLGFIIGALSFMFIMAFMIASKDGDE